MKHSSVQKYKGSIRAAADDAAPEQSMQKWALYAQGGCAELHGPFCIERGAFPNAVDPCTYPNNRAAAGISQRLYAAELWIMPVVLCMM